MDIKRGLTRDLLLMLLSAIPVWWVSGRFDLLESLVEYSRMHEHLELDEWIVAGLFMLVASALVIFRQWRLAQKAQRRAETRTAELQLAMQEVKTLRGILPICYNCKRIRNDAGYWTQLEEYLAKHSEAMFSHGLCEECAHKLFPEFADDPAG